MVGGMGLCPGEVFGWIFLQQPAVRGLVLHRDTAARPHHALVAFVCLWSSSGPKGSTECGGECW